MVLKKPYLTLQWDEKCVYMAVAAKSIYSRREVLEFG